MECTRVHYMEIPLYIHIFSSAKNRSSHILLFDFFRPPDLIRTLPFINAKEISFYELLLLFSFFFSAIHAHIGRQKYRYRFIYFGFSVALYSFEAISKIPTSLYSLTPVY